MPRTMHFEDIASKVLVFDWDDTICPSTFVDCYQIDHISELPQDVQELFHLVARCAERCLREASKFGEVIIITNSDEGWVKYSAKKFVPRLLPCLENYKIISARTLYEKFYPHSSLCWKAAAFAHEVNEIFEMHGAYAESLSNKSCDSLALTDVSSSSSDDSQSAAIPVSSTSSKGPPKREIISFGDGMEERTAVRIVAEQLSSIPKSVMFLQSPTPVQLIGQLVMLTSHMKYVCQHDSNLDLEISLEQAEQCADSYFKRHNLRIEDDCSGGGTGITKRIKTNKTATSVPLSVTL